MFSSHYIKEFSTDRVAASVFEVHCRCVSTSFLFISKPQHIRIYHTYFCIPWISIYCLLLIEF